MRLTLASDLALRILILICQEPKTTFKVASLAERLDLSRNHVMKIVARLAYGGFLKTLRGRGGGVKLGMDAEVIRIGDVVALMEPDATVVDCRQDKRDCPYLPCCALKGSFAVAAKAFVDKLNSQNLADIARFTQSPAAKLNAA